MLSADIFRVLPTDGTATQEILDRAIGLLSEGTKLSTEALNKLKTIVEDLDDLLQEADKNIAKLQKDFVLSNGINVTAEYLQAYWKAKEELGEIRTELREYAIRTEKTTKLIKILIEEVYEFDETTTDVTRIQFMMVEMLVDETLKALKVAKQKYNEAIHSMNRSSNLLATANTGIERMLNSRSAEYARWTTEVRAGTYSTCGAVTAGLIVADIFGCLGKSNQSLPAFPLVVL